LEFSVFGSGEGSMNNVFLGLDKSSSMLRVGVHGEMGLLRLAR